MKSSRVVIAERTPEHQTRVRRHTAMGDKVYPSGSGYTRLCVHAVYVKREECVHERTKLASSFPVESVIQLVIEIPKSENPKLEIHKVNFQGKNSDEN